MSLFYEKSTNSIFEATHSNINLVSPQPYINVIEHIREWNLTPEYKSERHDQSTHELELKFKFLKKKWEDETIFMSSSSDIVMNFNYQMMIGMGPQALPFIRDELKVNAGHWFWALKAITGTDPVHEADRGNLPKMTRSWLDWLDKNI
jgi:hypothetical protein